MSGADAAAAALTPLDDVLAIVAGRVRPVAPRFVAAADAAGCVAAADMVAPDDVPPAAMALRDGWAICAADFAGASPYAPVSLRAAPAWVEAGEPLPPLTDTVLPVEAVQAGPAGNAITMDAAAGDGVRGRGCDLAAGDIVVRAGSIIAPAALPALAAAAGGAVPVRVPRLALIAVGGAGEARNAQAAAGLAALVGAAGRAAGAEIAAAIGVGREAAGIAAAIREHRADAAIVIGGSGYGRSDASAAALRQAGELVVRNVAIRPGDTTCFGMVAGRPVLVVPGRSDAGLAAFLCLGLPLLRRLAGRSPVAPMRRLALTRKVTSMIGMSDIVFARSDGEAAEPIGGEETPLSGLARADCWLIVPPGSEGYPAATQVGVWPL